MIETMLHNIDAFVVLLGWAFGFFFGWLVAFVVDKLVVGPSDSDFDGVLEYPSASCLNFHLATTGGEDEIRDQYFAGFAAWRQTRAVDLSVASFSFAEGWHDAALRPMHMNSEMWELSVSRQMYARIVKMPAVEYDEDGIPGVKR